MFSARSLQPRARASRGARRPRPRVYGRIVCGVRERQAATKAPGPRTRLGLQAPPAGCFGGFFGSTLTAGALASPASAPYLQRAATGLESAGRRVDLGDQLPRFECEIDPFVVPEM